MEKFIDDIDSQHVFDLIRDIKDPEMPMSLEELKVLSLNNVFVNNNTRTATVSFTPTIKHCSLVTMIGLSILIKLMQTLPKPFKIDVYLTPGSHLTEDAVNKQLADKERIAAALENKKLMEIIDGLIKTV